MTSENISITTEPVAEPSVAVNTPDEFVVRWTRGGDEVKILAADAARLEAELGLASTKYDFDVADREWSAAYEGVGTLVHDTIEQFKRQGYVDDPQYDVLNTAMKKFMDAHQYLAGALANCLPREALIESLAEHVEKHGNMDNLTLLKRFEPTVKAYRAVKSAQA